ncbi:embryo-specific protein ATS3A-like [Aristolochia californica]|uniref:embryo-specific protein ATS3A-like n=1 Tax=Aristolochia californica TaxID=171875 RepID=UPI0035E16139
MAQSVLLLLYGTLLSFLIFSQADRSDPQPRALPSLEIKKIQYPYGCSYTVIIRTSCSSPIYTRDAISIAFGDAYGNQVYAPKLEDPWSRTFERCSTDTFVISGPCCYQICYVYLMRRGWDGWRPETVKIYSPTGRPVTFYYNLFLPSGVWYAVNLCGRIFSTNDNNTNI